MFMPRKCQGNDGVILPPGDFFEANMMNSVFSELSLNVLDPIHDFSSSIHLFIELNLFTFKYSNWQVDQVNSKVCWNEILAKITQ